MKCESQFREMYGREPEGIAFCPYRICTLGAHIDHQNGKINGFAIDKGIHIAYARKQNGVVELSSLNFPKRAQFHIREIPEQKAGDWADHLRGAAKVLTEETPLQYGLAAVIEGTLPVGGLSSSASVIIAFLKALCAVNGVHLEPWTIIRLAKRAENEYVGVSCGKLDQSCEVLSRQGRMLFLDCADDSFRLIPTPESMPAHEIAVFFSGVERSLANSKYNLRVDECKSAAYDLLAFAGMEYGKYADTRLREVPREVYEQYRDRLPVPFRKRADHFYGEIRRAELGAEAWERGDLETYGRLIFESGKSSVENYECGSPELIALYEIMTRTKGIYGGRFSGAGFKGCCMALTDPARREEIQAEVTAAYLKRFPEMEGKFSAHFCRSADGVVI